MSKRLIDLVSIILEFILWSIYILFVRVDIFEKVIFSLIILLLILDVCKEELKSEMQERT